MNYKDNLIECIMNYTNLYSDRELELMDISELTRLMNTLTCPEV